ncbi:transaldolase Tal [Mycobacteroides abscessus subsp. abscessus]|nr:transaldolase Tal [Mycobacteroides abscessus subsp. abscessus]
MFAVFEREGVEKFEASWAELLSATAEELRAAASGSEGN